MKISLRFLGFYALHSKILLNFFLVHGKKNKISETEVAKIRNELCNQIKNYESDRSCGELGD